MSGHYLATRSTLNGYSERKDAMSTSESKKSADTSITDTAVRKFLKESPVNAALYCEKQSGFILLKLSKGGSWRYRYSDKTGKRRIKVIGGYPAMKPTEAAWWAQNWRNNGVDPLAERKAARQSALNAETAAGQRTLGKYLDAEYSRAQGRKKGGGKLTIGRIRSVFAEWMDRDMLTITKGDIEAWHSGREKAGIAYATVKRDFGALKTLVRHAFKNGVLDRHPLQDVQLLAPSHADKVKALSAESTQDRRMLTDAERIGLLSGLERWDEELRAQRRSSRTHGKAHLPSLDHVAYAHWFIPYALLALHTGLRCGDLYSLTWQELNVRFGRLQKYPEKTLHNPDPIKIDIPLNDEIKDVMTRWWAQCGKPDTGLVFASPRTGLRLSSTAHQKPWENIKRLGELPGELVFYSLRHNFISTLLGMGVSTFEVARLAGHKSTRMIEDNYGHLCPAAAASSMQAFGKVITQKSEFAEPRASSL